MDTNNEVLTTKKETMKDKTNKPAERLDAAFGDVISDATSDFKTLKFYITSKDINQQDCNGQTLLHFACNAFYDFGSRGD